jgi:hypothetical protein
VLLDETQAKWGAGDLDALRGQTSRDFEVVARAELAQDVRAVGSAGDSPLAWLQEAIDEARGRWILLLPRSARPALHATTFVEQLLHAFAAKEGTVGVVLADAPEITRHAFSQLDDVERLSLWPAAVAFARPLWGKVPKIPLESEASPLADLAIGLQAIGPVQWRLIQTSEAGPPWSRYPAGHRSDEVDLNLSSSRDKAETAMRHVLAHQAPRLPELTPGTVRRWDESEPWVPPQTHLLCRHLNPETGFRAVTIERKPPFGYEFERVLGCARLFPAPGARRLVHAEHSYKLVDPESALAEGEYELGYIEEQPLPMLAALELRRVPGTEQETLVAGAEDPLIYGSEQLAVLGWVEAHPILPRAEETLHTGPWGVNLLRREVDRKAWRHVYRVDTPDEPSDGVAIGSLHRNPGPGLVALRRRSDGRLASEFCTPGRASRNPRRIGGWLAEPLRTERRASLRVKGSGSRLRHLARHFRARRLVEDEGETLGYLRPMGIPGSSALYSTIHPVTGDQMVTRSPQEATDQGYVLDGILGAIFDPPR